MKKNVKIALWILAAALVSPLVLYVAIAVWYEVECRFPIKGSFQTLKIDDICIEIESDMIDIDYSQLYIKGSLGKKQVFPSTLFGGHGNYPRTFALIPSVPSNDVVGVVEARHENNGVLAVFDFSNEEYWVSSMTSDVSLATGEVLLGRLQQTTGTNILVFGKDDYLF